MIRLLFSKSRPAYTVEKLFLRWSFISLLIILEIKKWPRQIWQHCIDFLHMKRSVPLEQPSSGFVVINNVICFPRCLIGPWNRNHVCTVYWHKLPERNPYQPTCTDNTCLPLDPPNLIKDHNGCCAQVWTAKFAWCADMWYSWQP